MRSLQAAGHCSNALVSDGCSSSSQPSISSAFLPLWSPNIRQAAGPHLALFNYRSSTAKQTVAKKERRNKQKGPCDRDFSMVVIMHFYSLSPQILTAIALAAGASCGWHSWCAYRSCHRRPIASVVGLCPGRFQPFLPLPSTCTFGSFRFVMC